MEVADEDISEEEEDEESDQAEDHGVAGDEEVDDMDAHGVEEEHDGEESEGALTKGLHDSSTGALAMGLAQYHAVLGRSSLLPRSKAAPRRRKRRDAVKLRCVRRRMAPESDSDGLEGL